MPDNDAIEKALMQLDEDIKNMLADPSITTRELLRGLIRSQRSMLPFFAQVAINTKRIEDMYPFYKTSAWLTGIMIVSMIGIVFSVLTHSINLP